MAGYSARSGCPHERSIRKSSVSKTTNIGSRCQGPADPFPLKENPPEGWSSLSPLTLLTPSKPRLILACIVGIKIDVQARYSSISKLEDVAETTTGSFAPSPVNP